MRIGVMVVMLLVIFRLILPYVALEFFNNRLARIDGYFGHVADLDMRHGFIEAIYPSLDHQVNIGLVKEVDPKEENKSSLFQKAFNSSSPGKDKKLEEKNE